MIDPRKPRRLHQDIFDTLLANKLVEIDELAIVTKGDLDGVSGSTNEMKIVKIKSAS